MCQLLDSEWLFLSQLSFYVVEIQQLKSLSLQVIMHCIYRCEFVIGSAKIALLFYSDFFGG